MSSCAGAAAYGTEVYGAAGSQQAIPGGNVIAMKVGGKKSRRRRGGNLNDIILPAGLVYANSVLGKKSRTGGNVVSELAVPATLMYANHTFGKRRSSKRHVSRKNRKSRRSRRTYRR